jgi:hypothetical protein
LNFFRSGNPTRWPIAFLIAILAPLLGHGETAWFQGTISPDKKLAIGYDPHQQTENTTFSLVSFPGLKLIGRHMSTQNIVSGSGFDESFWNEKAHLVALVSEGVSISRTAVFAYSSHGLKELPYPDLSLLPEKWYPKAVITQCHITVDGWIGRDRLRLFVSGRLTQGDPFQIFEYNLNAFVRFPVNGPAKVEEVLDLPLESSK